MERISAILLLGIVLSGCGQQDHLCAKDGKVIVNLNESVIVGQASSGAPSGLASMISVDEKPYSVLPIAAVSAEKGAPVEHIALGYKDRLFCSAACASELLAHKNHVADSLRIVRSIIHHNDSMVADSIRRGLIP